MPATCQPRPNESENEFIVRAHKALAREIPDTDERNQAVFALWRESQGDGPLEQKAYSLFDAERFEHARDVPVFKEHEYVDRHGETQKYGLDELLAVCERCNERIEDTGNFAVLSEGHTPTRDQLAKGAKNPPALGFAGPFRLGQIGNKTPRWAIFADEHWFKSAASERQRYPTRSPEVWLNPDMRQRFFDPIAALGSETPRLDMGVRFARLESGDEVEKYSATAVSPGPMNTFAPRAVGVGRRTDRYGAGPQPSAAPPVSHTTHPPHASEQSMDSPDNAAGPSDISDELIHRFISAFMQTDMAQFIRSLMAEREAGGAEEDQMGGDPNDPMGGPPGMDMGMGGEPDGDEAAPPMGGPPAMGGAPAPPAAPPGAPPAAPSPPSKPPQDRDGEKYSRASTTPQEDDLMSSAEHEELHAKYSRLEAELAAVRAENAKIRRESDNKIKHSRLVSLRQTHAFDLRKAYQRAEPMDMPTFDLFAQDIQENYARIPVNASVPVAESIEDDEQERYSREVADRAEAIVQEQRNSGNHDFRYSDGRRMAEAELASRAPAKS